MNALYDGLLEGSIDSGGHDSLLDLGEEGLLGGLEVGDEGRLPLSDVVDGDTVEETVDTGAEERDTNVVSRWAREEEFEGNALDDRDLDLDGKGLVLALLEELGETGATVEEEAGRGVEIGSELGERGDITVLSEVELEGSSNGLHDLRGGEERVSFRRWAGQRREREDEPWSGRRNRHGTRRVRR